MEKYQIVYRNPAELKENPDNAKVHPAKQIAKIKRSIESFGFLTPLVIDPSDVVLCGNGRLAAANELRLEQVPTICAKNLSEAQRRGFALADNKSAEGATWDDKQLASELQKILDLGGIDILDTGFEIGEVDFIIGAQNNPAGGERVENPFDPARVTAVCRPGDLWILGRHLLFCGDALDPLSYKVLLDDSRAEMIFTDPPYNIKIDGVVSGLGRVKHDDFAQASGEMSRDQFGEFLAQVMCCMQAASANGSLHYLCIDWRQVDLLLQTGRVIYGDPKALCVWNKQAGGMGALYRSQHELIAVFKNGEAPHVNNIQLGVHGRNRTNVWNYPGMSSFGRGRMQKLAMHPTVKNLDMVADAIMDCSKIGSLILDPFGGSGTTLIAAEWTQRRAALIELDAKYCDVILRRFYDATGIEPVNAWTGEVVAREPANEEGIRRAG